MRKSSSSISDNTGKYNNGENSRNRARGISQKDSVNSQNRRTPKQMNQQWPKKLNPEERQVGVGVAFPGTKKIKVKKQMATTTYEGDGFYN